MKVRLLTDAALLGVCVNQLPSDPGFFPAGVYEAIPATNQPKYREEGKVFIQNEHGTDLLLEKSEYEVLDLLLVRKDTGEPLKIGDQVSGHRVDKYHATIEKIYAPGKQIGICYSGDVKTVWVDAEVCDAEWLALKPFLGQVGQTNPEGWQTVYAATSSDAVALLIGKDPLFPLNLPATVYIALGNQRHPNGTPMVVLSHSVTRG